MNILVQDTTGQTITKHECIGLSVFIFYNMGIKNMFTAEIKKIAKLLKCGILSFNNHYDTANSATGPKTGLFSINAAISGHPYAAADGAAYCH
ncbi:MAG: hypothetical protein KGJ11_06220 [Candidatus Omnitrophica bacterium]|nr:hypothetical protein [Candidatus Omnitrophota bacterium]